MKELPGLWQLVGGPLKGLSLIKDARTKRVSSYDKTGANADCWRVEPGETVVLADIKGPGCITHTWFTLSCPDKYYLRKVLLKMYWDGEENPSVLVPLGDFFGVGHGKVTSFYCLPLNMSANPWPNVDAAGMNCYFPMPFKESARIEITNEANEPIHALYFYIDYEEYDELVGEHGYFHAQWRRENPCGGTRQIREDFDAQNLTGEDNYVILEAEGRGHYVGCVLSVHNLCGGWWGEGDDMIFIDGEKWPPSLHGTGTEDYFGHAWGMQDNSYLFNGTSFHEAGREVVGEKITVYRFHIQDPVVFKKSIKVTIEHGHANAKADDWSSVAYWYQVEPHKPFDILPVGERLPREYIKEVEKQPVEDFCKNYMVIGPFDNPVEGEERKGLSIPYPPEREEFDIERDYPGKFGERVYWQKVIASEEGRLDFNNIFGYTEYAVCYAVTHVYSPEAKEAYLLVGSDDGVKIWVNGEVVHEVLAKRAAVPDQDRIKIKLRKGWNRILAKVEQETGGWALYMRLTLTEGGLVYSALGEV